MREQLGRIVIVFAGAAAALAGQSSLKRESAADRLNNLGAEAYLAGNYPEAESLYTRAMTEWQAVSGGSANRLLAHPEQSCRAAPGTGPVRRSRVALCADPRSFRKKG